MPVPPERRYLISESGISNGFRVWITATEHSVPLSLSFSAAPTASAEIFPYVTISTPAAPDSGASVSAGSVFSGSISRKPEKSRYSGEFGYLTATGPEASSELVKMRLKYEKSAGAYISKPGMADRNDTSNIPW